MNRSNYVIAALAVVAFASPSLAEDISKAGPNAKTEQTLRPGGEVKSDATGGQAGGEIRGSGARVGSQVETRKGEPRWHRAHAEQVVIVDHRRHRHHHHDAM
ncbi:MAG TPA: hypothetical protein VKY22_26140 [Bradyrhizobium sp.]|nr:hypothetical protein [Bradyrhizobium sp.]